MLHQSVQIGFRLVDGVDNAMRFRTHSSLFQRRQPHHSLFFEDVVTALSHSYAYQASANSANSGTHSWMHFSGPVDRLFSSLTVDLTAAYCYGA